MTRKYIHPDTLPTRVGSSYPDQFKPEVLEREKKVLGDALVGWIFSPPRKFLESCRGLVE